MFAPFNKERPTMNIPYLCTAFLGFLVFGLGLNVSLHRRRSSDSLSDQKTIWSPIFRARTAHSNACQYAPMFSVLILLNQGKIAAALAIVAVVARYLHAFGFIAFSKPGPNPFIYWGAVGTYLSGLGLSALLLAKHLPA